MSDFTGDFFRDLQDQLPPDPSRPELPQPNHEPPPLSFSQPSIGAPPLNPLAAKMHPDIAKAFTQFSGQTPGPGGLPTPVPTDDPRGPRFTLGNLPPGLSRLFR